MSEIVPAEEHLTSAHDFFFELPLYSPINTEDLDDISSGDVDGFSPANNIETTYKITMHNLGDSWPWVPGMYLYKLTCKRKGEELYFITLEGEDFIVKVGQMPSLATMQFAEIGKKYEKSLNKTDLALFKKAIGLASHGAGAGSFVYLRKIFEKLIHETFVKHAKAINLDEEKFISARMSEKVDMLKDFLPSQLVEMKSIYSILSKGVHELTEKECLAYFPALKLSIELILDQRLQEIAEEKRKNDVKKQIQQMTQELNKGK